MTWQKYESLTAHPFFICSEQMQGCLLLPDRRSSCKIHHAHIFVGSVRCNDHPYGIQFGIQNVFAMPERRNIFIYQ